MARGFALNALIWRCKNIRNNLSTSNEVVTIVLTLFCVLLVLKNEQLPTKIPLPWIIQLLDVVSRMKPQKKKTPASGCNLKMGFELSRKVRKNVLSYGFKFIIVRFGANIQEKNESNPNEEEEV